MIAPDTWYALPPHTRHCGLFDEDPVLPHLQAQLADDPLPQPIPRPPPEHDDPDVWTFYDDPITGNRWVYAATDGACSHQAIALLARAAYAAC